VRRNGFKSEGHYCPARKAQENFLNVPLAFSLCPLLCRVGAEGHVPCYIAVDRRCSRFIVSYSALYVQLHVGPNSA